MEKETDIRSLLLDQKWEASFYQMVEQYSPQLFHCAYTILKDTDDAHDAVQDAFVSIWKNLHKFNHQSAPFTWCYSIVRHAAIRAYHLRKKHSSHASIDTQYNLTQSEELPWDSEQINIELELAIRTLPEKQKYVFEMRYYHSMPFDQISDLTGTSVGALKASYHHARKKVEEILKHKLNP